MTLSGKDETPVRLSTLEAEREESSSHPEGEGAAASSETSAQRGPHPQALLPPLKQGARERNPYIEIVEGLSERIVSAEQALTLKGRWQSRFPQDAPLYLELGSGYGHFLAELAPRHPERNYLGIELKFKRLFKAQEKVQGLHNVQYLRFNVLLLEHIFVPGEIAGVYINFPDPWPKKDQIKKRMVSPSLVQALEHLLAPGAKVFLKSDWEPNRTWFVDCFAGSGFSQTDYIPALSDWNRSEHNVETSYERRFRREGLPCFFFEYTRAAEG